MTRPDSQGKCPCRVLPTPPKLQIDPQSSLGACGTAAVLGYYNPLLAKEKERKLMQSVLDS